MGHVECLQKRVEIAGGSLVEKTDEIKVLSPRLSRRSLPFDGLCAVCRLGLDRLLHALIRLLEKVAKHAGLLEGACLLLLVLLLLLV